MELKLEQVVIRDEEIVVFFPDESIVEGELVIAPIHAFKTLEDVPEYLMEKMFHIVNKMSSSLFDILGCQGTNLLIQNGTLAGQKDDSIFIRLIPRFDKDSLKLDWAPTPSKPEDLEGAVQSFNLFHDQIKNAKDIEKRKSEVEKKEVKHIKQDPAKDNYLLKSLRRNP